MRKVWTLCVGLLAIGLAACSSGQPPDKPADVICPPSPPVEILDEGWQFQTDPDNVGLDQGWYQPDTNRDSWTIRPIGRAWEQDGVEYDGVAWYAREITWEESPAYLFLADADDSATVLVDGVQESTLDAGNPSIVLSLESPENRATVVLRIDDRGGFGGLKSPPRLGTTYESVLDEGRLIAYQETQNPDMPPAPSGAAWTMVGGIDEANETLIGREGFINPYAEAPAVQLWLRDSATGRTVNPYDQAKFTLVDNSPIVRMTHEAVGGITTGSTIFYDETDQAARWLVEVDKPEDTTFDELVIAIRPYRVNRTLVEYCHPVSPNSAHIWVNSEPFLVAGIPAGRFENGADWAGLVYKLKPGKTELNFGLPVAKGRDFPPPRVDIAARLDEAANTWGERSNQATIAIPDGAVQAALDASLGYLLLASDPNGPHPGPLAHSAVWTRDAAYMGLALLMRGQADIARRYVQVIFAGQEASGRVPPIQGESIPWDNDEWDAQGQAIFLAMQVYRYTRDEEFLRSVYPNIAKAADYLIELRQQTKSAANPATRGLLPISLSAEDLADGEQHYFWDNFWALTGLNQAAEAALIVDPGDAGRWLAESDALRRSIDANLTDLLGDPAPYIPASVETLDNSGMARGTTPTLHPLPVYSPGDPLIRRAFDYYAQRFIQPYDGGYLHREGQFWTYGGVELANAYLRLERGDMVHQILGWTLNHQTLPGAFAWAEQVDPQDYTFSGGDMPHAWMAASLTILIRNMLVLEYARGADDLALTLFQTAPLWWFESDRQVSAEKLPTIFGEVSLKTSGNLRSEDNRWIGELELMIDGATPPDGYRWVLPFAPVFLSSDNDTRLIGQELLIPGPGVIKLTFE